MLQIYQSVNSGNVQQLHVGEMSVIHGKMVFSLPTISRKYFVSFFFVFAIIPMRFILRSGTLIHKHVA